MEAGEFAISVPVCTRVLLVQDNPVNLTVAETLLRKAGARVETAVNGAAAVELATAGGFDVILMDVQMPEMDGFEATRRMREKGCRLPIIGLAAQALEGDRERCLAAGMSDCLTKPVAPETLCAEVTAWTRRAPVPSADPAALLEQLGGDREIYETIVRQFEKDGTAQVEAIRTALEQRDADTLWKVAHRLRGSLLVFLAGRAVCLVEEVEARAKRGELDRLPELVRALEEELPSLLEALKGSAGAVCPRPENGPEEL